MRILIVAGYYYPHIGGYVSAVMEIARGLFKIGYDVDVLTLNTEKTQSQENIDGITVYRLPCWNALNGTFPIPIPSLKSVKMIHQVIKLPYDVILTNTRFFLTSFIGAIIARIHHITLYHIEHGSKHSVVSNKIVDWIGRLYDHTVGSWIVRSAKCNIATCQATYDFLRHLKAKKIVIIPNCVDTDIYIKKTANLRQKLEISNNAIIITFIGRLIRAKGVQDLLSVFHSIYFSKSVNKDLCLLIVGNGNYRKELENLTSQLKLSNAVRFLGEKEKDEVIEILSISDIFVSPSYSEGLPTAIMEAASVGLPVIATNVGGASDIIREDETGFLVEVGNIAQMESKLISLILNAGQRTLLGEKARKLVLEKFSWNNSITKLGNLFQKNLSREAKCN